MILPAGVPLSGNLKDIPLPILFHFLKINSKTGILTVRYSLFSKSIHFQNGDILFATSNYPDDYLGEVLLKSGKINFKQYEITEEHLKSTGKTQGAILVEQGFVKPKDLFETLVIQIKGIAISLFFWEDAVYSFKESLRSQEESIGVVVDPDEIIQDGLTRIFDWTRLVRLLPPLHFVIKKNLVQIAKPFKWSSNLDWVFNLIDGERSVRDILTLSSTKALSCAQILNFFITTESLLPSLPFSHEAAKQPEAVPEAKRSAVEKAGDKEEKEIAWEETPKEVQIQKIREVFAKISSQNYYQILGVAPDVEKETIKRIYFKLAKRYHPDRYRGGALLAVVKEVESIFIHLTRAYDALSVDQTRTAYDKSLKEHSLQPPSEVQLAQDFFSRAATAYAKNDLKNAVYFLEESIRLFPESPEKYTVYLRYGQVISRVPGKLREAVDAFRKSALLDSSKAEPYVELGLAYAKTGLNDKAATAFQEALKRDSENKLAYTELAKLDKKIKNLGFL
jgi:curved DNA-binding protein CbpA